MDDKGAEYKIILLGDPGVGKTTFFLRIREQEYIDTEQRPSASIGVDDLLYEHVVDGAKVKVVPATRTRNPLIASIIIVP